MQNFNRVDEGKWALKVRVISLPLPKVIYIWNSNQLFSETTEPFCTLAFRNKEMKFCVHDAGHMTKMAATSVYGKNPSKIFFSGTGGAISLKLGM